MQPGNEVNDIYVVSITNNYPEETTCGQFWWARSIDMVLTGVSASRVCRLFV